MPLVTSHGTTQRQKDLTVVNISHFDRTQLPPARTFYERELGKIGRPDRRGWAPANCPFHKSKSGRSFSVNLDSGGFHCFGCTASGGDVVSFMRKRYNLSFRAACEQLGCWLPNGPDPATQQRLREAREARERQQKEEELQTAKERQERLAARDTLHGLERDYSTANHRLTQLRRGQPARYRGEEGLAWWFLSDTLPRIREAEFAYRRLAGLEGYVL